MDRQTRVEIIKRFLEEQCLSLLDSKGTEYSRGEEDVNSNFKRVAAGLDLSPIVVAYVYAAKHWDSITNYVKTGAAPSGEPIVGRIADLINYLLILMTLMEEDRVRVPVVWERESSREEEDGEEVDDHVTGCPTGTCCGGDCLNRSPVRRSLFSDARGVVASAVRDRFSRDYWSA